MTPAHVRRAIDSYLALAFPPESGQHTRVDLVAIRDAGTIQDVLDKMVFKRQDQVANARRYTLQLGNWRYPWMKFVLQEYLLEAEYFFSVDTHDNLNVRPDAPDYAAWQELKRFNRELSERIETAWRTEHLPTHDDLRALAEGIAKVEREERKTARLLVLDDERNVCESLRALLSARGYEVEVAFSGEQVLERLRKDPLPDLVILDFELPGLDGEEVLTRLRGDPRTENLPVLMATASDISLTRLRRVSGFLQKPYQRAVLFAMLGQLLQKAKGP